MTPELKLAIEERKKLGYSEDKIREELVAAGYDSETVSALLNAPTPDSVSSGQPVVSSENGIPGVFELIGSAVDFAKERYNLALILSIPLVIMSLNQYLINLYPENIGLSLGLAIVTLIALVTYFYFLLAVLYATSVKDETVSFSAGLTFSKSNIFKFAWITLLTTLAIWGGFILLFIPGIILSIYLYLGQFVFVAEGKTGLNAMSRSHELVKGNWQAVFGRLIGVALIFLLLFVILGFLIGFLSYFLGEESLSLLLSDSVLQILGSFATLISMHIGLRLYRSLAERQSNSLETPSKSILHGSFAVIGAVGIISLIALLVMFADEIAAAAQTQEVGSLEVGLEEAALEAKQRAEELRTLDSGE